MAEISVSQEGTVNAPADKVYEYLRDMHQHPKFLPPQFSDFKIESGGVGAGTVTTFTINAGGRSRQFRMTVAEPEPGRVMTESDANSTMVTRFTVAPRGGDASLVTIASTWQGAGGVGGFFERMFAPRATRSMYADELRRLDEYARQQQGS